MLLVAAFNTCSYGMNDNNDIANSAVANDHEKNQQSILPLEDIPVHELPYRRTIICQEFGLIKPFDLIHSWVATKIDSPEEFTAKFVNTTTPNGETALHYAAQQGDLRACMYLLANSAECNKQTTDGRTPLHIAAQFGHRHIYDLLVEAGADRNIQSNEGRTPQEILMENSVCIEAECPICFEPAQEDLVKSNACKHVFHSNCLNGWMERSQSCPQCRVAIDGLEAVVATPLSGQAITPLIKATQEGEGAPALYSLVSSEWRGYKHGIHNGVQAALALGSLFAVCAIKAIFFYKK